ncbi:hypothetical protein MKW94_030564, partial [Papaver nudicaule]|nr:hypothetical protein [Papaver nudicaule]
KFATRDEAKKWVLEKGKEKKCVMVSGKESRQNRIVLVCLRSGKNYPHRGKNYKCPENKTPKIYKPRTQKCECPFKIVIRKLLDDVWITQVANGCHNHEDLESPVVHPAGAKLKPEKIIKSN